MRQKKSVQATVRRHAHLADLLEVKSEEVFSGYQRSDFQGWHYRLRRIDAVTSQAKHQLGNIRRFRTVVEGLRVFGALLVHFNQQMRLSECKQGR